VPRVADQLIPTRSRELSEALIRTANAAGIDPVTSIRPSRRPDGYYVSAKLAKAYLEKTAPTVATLAPTTTDVTSQEGEGDDGTPS